MKPSYDQLKKFMESYFRAYNDYAQREETMHLMDKFWSDDFVSVAYMQLKGQSYPLRIVGKKAWQDFLIKGHLTVIEDFIPLEYTIDPEQMSCTARLRIKKFALDTQELLTDADGIAFYRLTVTREGKPIIKSLDFYCGDPARFASLYKPENNLVCNEV